MTQIDSEIKIEHFDEELEDPIPFEYEITSYGADFPVDGLVKRIKNQDIFIPEFQRGYVWTIKQASRLIESLLLGLPIPGIFLGKDEYTQKLMVIDGQQRLKTLTYFFDGIFEPSGRKFTLRNVQANYKGVSYKDLTEEDRRKIDDSLIHATIVKQDQPGGDNSSIYHIFERLNTGGALLQPQEIRACVYHGDFAKLLSEINQCEAWREIYGNTSPRMRDQELILRFLALKYMRSEYKRPMKEFLNKFMARNRVLRYVSGETCTRAFSKTICMIYSAVGKGAFKPKRNLNAAVFDGVMVGASELLEIRPNVGVETVAMRYRKLLEDEEFQSASERATADEESVKRRLDRAAKVFSEE